MKSDTGSSRRLAQRAVAPIDRSITIAKPPGDAKKLQPKMVRVSAPDKPQEFVMLDIKSSVLDESTLLPLIDPEIHSEWTMALENGAVLVPDTIFVCLVILAQVCNRGDSTIVSIISMHDKDIIHNVFLPFTQRYSMIKLWTYIDRYFDGIVDTVMHINIIPTGIGYRAIISFDACEYHIDKVVELHDKGIIEYLRYAMGIFVIKTISPTFSDRFSIAHLLRDTPAITFVQCTDVDNKISVNSITDPYEFETAVRIRLLPQEF